MGNMAHIPLKKTKTKGKSTLHQLVWMKLNEQLVPIVVGSDFVHPKVGGGLCQHTTHRHTHTHTASTLFKTIDNSPNPKLQPHHRPLVPSHLKQEAQRTMLPACGYPKNGVGFPVGNPTKRPKGHRASTKRQIQMCRRGDVSRTHLLFGCWNV